ncbi:MAG TPA: hypothetical protein H9880_10865 [Candidatus Anaerobutyricum avicola]|nr:hypothetical protein [Candidatus Anaerobutyricum avicola]
MPEERKTVGMLTGSKQELFERDHPVIRQLREIPELIFPDEMEKLPPSALSLKQLFTRKQMDENHVDCLILYRIAAGALHILEELSRRGICPGLIEIGDFYAELLPGSVQVYLTHPEKFQLLHYEQDYEWYPEDERLFGELELFDKDAQRRADVRLLYKILVASAKGNVKMPPKYTEADYSELFYKALPDEWKELFQERPDCDYATMKEMLRQCIAMEESFARAARERLDEKAQKKLEEEEWLSAENGGQEERQGKKTLFSMIVLLRTELEDSRIMSRMLYQLQDELETETSLSQWEWRQAFVFGNGNIAVKEFATYEPGFRCQCEQEIKDYSAGEALIIAANLMGEAMRGHQAGSPHRGRHEKGGAVPEQQEHIFRMYALADGRLKNDRVFQAALSMLNDCQRQGMEFYLLTGEDSRCEACQKLDQLMQEGTYADPSHS